MRDMKNVVDFAPSIAPAAITATATGAGVNLAGYNGAMVCFNVGVITDGTHTPKVQESADNSAFTDVAAGDLNGSFAALASAVNQRVGYKGTKQYVRAVSTVAGATTGGVYGATVVRGHPVKQPV